MAVIVDLVRRLSSRTWSGIQGLRGWLVRNGGARGNRIDADPAAALARMGRHRVDSQPEPTGLTGMAHQRNAVEYFTVESINFSETFIGF